MSRLALVAAALSCACAAGAAQSECLPPPDGLVAWYPGERHADDAAGFHHGTLFPGTSYVDGVRGEAFRFDGVGNGVATDTTSAEQRALRDSFSYSMWVNPTGTLPACGESTGGACFGVPWAVFPTHGDNAAPPGEFGLGAGIGVAVGSNGVCVGQHAAFLVSCLAFAAVPIADWTHVVAVIENKTPRIYVNGVLVRTGIASAREFVFAGWELFGAGSTLGRYAGDLDELALFGRALGDEEIAELFLAGGDGMCAAECAQRADDAFEGADVISTSGLRSSHPDGMFGATDASPEADSLLFQDGLPDGAVHSIEWTVDSPLQMDAIGLHALHDDVNLTTRAFRHVRLQARAAGESYRTIYERDVVLPYAPGGRELHHCAKLRPGVYQEFRAEFTQDGPAGFSGPRVMELDGLGTPEHVFRDGFEEA